MSLEQYRQFHDPINDDALFLLCVVRNERLLLDHFIRHYQAIGITHFIFIDNGSDDGSFDYLRNHPHINSELYRTDDSYRTHNFGMDWILSLLREKCQHKWCLIADADELFIADGASDLNVLRAQMGGANAILSITVDFYAHQALPYQMGEDFLSHSCYYDALNHHYRPNIHSKYRHPIRTIWHANADRWNCTGGVRRRVFGINPCLVKRCFFHFDFQQTHHIHSGCHFITSPHSQQSLRYHNKLAIIRHFKFIRPDLSAYFTQRVAQDQDWHNNHEYHAYQQHWPCSLYHPMYSQSYVNDEQLFAAFEPAYYQFAEYCHKRTRRIKMLCAR